MIAVTVASGHLGRLVIDSLFEKVPPSEIVAAARNPEKVADLASKGIAVRQADYARPDTLRTVFTGLDQPLCRLRDPGVELLLEGFATG